jgi:hypothetical protein
LRGKKISLDFFGSFGDVRRRSFPNDEIHPALKERPGFFFLRVRMTGGTARLRQFLQHQLVAALAADFEAGGAEAVKRLREKDPAGYLRAVAAAAADVQSLDTAWSELTDADIAAAIAAIREVVGAGARDDGGAGAQAKGEQTPALPALPETETVS